MRHDPLLISERVKRLLNIRTVFIFHIFLTGFILLEITLDHKDYTKQEFLTIVAGCIIFGVYGLIRYLNLWKINNHPTLYLTIYHIVLFLCLGFAAAKYSPYLFVWLILVYMTNYFYGKKGVYISLAVFFLTILVHAFRFIPPGAEFEVYFTFIASQFTVVTLISLFFVESEVGGDKDRELLLTSMDKAQLERQRLISLINSMADGVIATDDKGIIKLYNAAAINILDTNQSLQDKNIRDCIMIIDQSAKMVDPIAEAEKTNVNVTSTDMMLVYPDGEKINVFLSVSPIKLGFRSNSERGYIIAFRDITREKSLEEERNEFISVVSHELRTPIAITEANISNAQFIVEKGNNLEAVKSALEASHKQAVFLANMINDLSTLSRAERGKLDMKTEIIDPREIMTSLDDDYKKDAETKGLQFSTEIEDSTPKSIYSNRLYIREILQNFVTNSIKYTKEGGVQVIVRGDEDGIAFIVKDTGIGISKTDQKRVFDKFFRSEDFRTRESSGTGLGLYVTKKLMKLIGAEIELKSKLNEGSSFIVHIPDLGRVTATEVGKEM
jgi:two-component system phosphate regulon sensor histidine kinase PhoR